MKRLAIVTLAAIGLLAGGCPQAQPPAAETTDFSDFVTRQISQTSDTADPAGIDDLNFAFDEDPTRYDGLFG